VLDVLASAGSELRGGFYQIRTSHERSQFFTPIYACAIDLAIAFWSQPDDAICDLTGQRR
jgi:hypothetical protein